MKSIRRIYYPNIRNPSQHIRRVAAYCRVSTLHDEQQNSLVFQMEYYETKIKACKNWQFAGVYADQATGRNSIKRKQFQMIMVSFPVI